MIKFNLNGNFKKVETFFNDIKSVVSDGTILEKYGKIGVEALKKNTPIDTGLTSNSWSYKVIHYGDRSKIQFLNSNIQNGVSIAIVLQYGHATNNGGWVEGIDYINPALAPVFEDLATSAWREVTRR